MAVGFAVGTAVVSADLSLSLVPLRGTGREVAAAGLYTSGYWVSAVLALLVVVTLIVSSTRAKRRGRLTERPRAARV